MKFYETWQRIRKRFLEFFSDSYFDFYRRSKRFDSYDKPTDYPKPGDWEGNAKWQFDYVRSLGLTRYDHFLDYGCGPLRLGRLLLPWLRTGRYTGVDLSPNLIRIAREEYSDMLAFNQGTVAAINPSQFFAYHQFDFIWANSVLTHLPPEQAREFFHSIQANLSYDGRAFVTYYETDVGVEENAAGTGFAYSREAIQEILGHGLEVIAYDPNPNHPQGQHVVSVRFSC